MANVTCPMCGSSNIRFEVRQGGRKSKSNYYRTGIKDSWVLPAGQKRYNSRQKYVSLCQCQDCGNLWKKESVGSVLAAKIFGIACYFAVYLGIIGCLTTPQQFSAGTYIAYIVVCVVMTAGIGWWIWRKLKK